MTILTQKLLKLQVQLYAVSGQLLFIICRHIIAALHFNYNLHREDVVNQDGTLSVKVTYPKFKNGEATVRSRKVEQNFGMVLVNFMKSSVSFF